MEAAAESIAGAALDSGGKYAPLIDAQAWAAVDLLDGDERGTHVAPSGGTIRNLS